jgi:hypothetical protein
VTKRVMGTPARVMATKVLCNKEGGCDSSRGNGNEGGGQTTEVAATWAMMTATRLAGKEEGKCKSGKGNGDGNEGGRQWQQWLKQGQRWQWW